MAWAAAINAVMAGLCFGAFIDATMEKRKGWACLLLFWTVANAAFGIWLLAR